VDKNKSGWTCRKEVKKSIIQEGNIQTGKIHIQAEHQAGREKTQVRRENSKEKTQ
jgi:hypothetical protein